MWDVTSRAMHFKFKDPKDRKDQQHGDELVRVSTLDELRDDLDTTITPAKRPRKRV